MNSYADFFGSCNLMTLGSLGFDVSLPTGTERINEPPHDKTNKIACAPSEDSDQPGHPPSLISLHCPHEES